MSSNLNDRYLKEYRCGPCSRVEILLDQKLGMPADGEHCPQCKTRMLLLRIQPMACVIEKPWEFIGTQITQETSDAESTMQLFRETWGALKKTFISNGTVRKEAQMPITKETQARIVSDVKAGKLNYKPVPCSECGIELSIESFTRNEGLGNDGTLGKPRYCDVCDSIVKSMATSPGLIEAHEKWESDQYRKKGLIDGR